MRRSAGCSQYVAYRGTIPMEEIIETAGTDPDDVLMFIGPNLHGFNIRSAAANFTTK